MSRKIVLACFYKFYYFGKIDQTLFGNVMSAFAANGIITLLTDFGETDAYVGSMHGVILSINRNATIVNISHELPKHNITAGSFVLSNCYRYYPSGTIHVAIVDPGVGGPRKPVAAVVDNHIFVAPDNGILSYIYRDYPECTIYELANTELFVSSISHTFHGRDIFSPVAAHLSAGCDIASIGPVLKHPVMCTVHEAIVTAEGIKGRIIYCDHFGNLITNISANDLQNRSFRLQLANYDISEIFDSYVTGRPRQPIAVIGSSNYLEIAINQDSAADLLKMTTNDEISVEFTDVN